MSELARVQKRINSYICFYVAEYKRWIKRTQYKMKPLKPEASKKN